VVALRHEQVAGICVIVLVLLGSSLWILSYPMRRLLLENEDIEFTFSPAYHYGNFSVAEYEKNTAVIFEMDLDAGSDNRTVIMFQVHPRDVFFESFDVTDNGADTCVGVAFAEAGPSIDAWVFFNTGPGDYVWVFFADPADTTYPWTATFNVTLRYTLL